MSTRTSAGRYARALLEVSIADADPVQVERDLGAVVDLLATHQDLRQALTNPAVPAHGKRAVIDALLPRLAVAAPVGRLLQMLADRDRLALLPALAAAYRERLLAHQHVLRAEVTTAMPLGGDQAAALEQRLAGVTGQQVRMTTRVDPALIGGLVARIGGTVYDGSMVTQLSRMRHKFTEPR